MYEHRTKCRACKSEKLSSFLNLGKQPMANAFLKNQDQFAVEKFFPLKVCFCENCNLVQLEDVVDAKLLFYDYVYVSSTSPVFIKHFEDYSDSVHKRFNVTDKLVIDIGSNDGILLKPFKALGARVLGVDPAKNIADRATADGIPTIADFFTKEVAEKILADHGKAKVITANNAFAHIDDWDGLLEAVKIVLADDGVFIIEAPYLEEYIVKKYFDTTYHEHLNYLAIRPLDRYFDNLGLEIFDVIKVSSHGGSARIFVKRKEAEYDREKNVEDFINKELELGFDKIETYIDYAREIEDIKAKTVKMLKQFKSEDKTIVGYGAAAKGNTLLNYMGIDSTVMDYIIDDSPYKQELWAPGSHIQVVNSEKMLKDQPDYVFILAWNFAEPIIKKCREQGLTKAQYIVPLPEPVIIK